MTTTRIRHLRVYVKIRTGSYLACDGRRTVTVRGWATRTAADWRFVRCRRCTRTKIYRAKRKAAQDAIDALRVIPELRTGGFAIRPVDGEINHDAGGVLSSPARTGVTVRHRARDLVGVFTDRLMRQQPHRYELALADGRVYEFEARVIDSRTNSDGEVEFTLRPVGQITIR